MNKLLKETYIRIKNTENYKNKKVIKSKTPPILKRYKEASKISEKHIKDRVKKQLSSPFDVLSIASLGWTKVESKTITKTIKSNFNSGNINNVDARDSTAISYAIRLNNIEGVKYLIEKGACFTIKDHDELNSLDYLMKASPVLIMLTLSAINKRINSLGSYKDQKPLLDLRDEIKIRLNVSEKEIFKSGAKNDFKISQNLIKKHFNIVINKNQLGYFIKYMLPLLAKNKEYGFIKALIENMPELSKKFNNFILNEVIRSDNKVLAQHFLDQQIFLDSNYIGEWIKNAKFLKDPYARLDNLIDTLANDPVLIKLVKSMRVNILEAVAKKLKQSKQLNIEGLLVFKIAKNCGLEGGLQLRLLTELIIGSLRAKVSYAEIEKSLKKYFKTSVADILVQINGIIDKEMMEVLKAISRQSIAVFLNKTVNGKTTLFEKLLLSKKISSNNNAEEKAKQVLEIIPQKDRGPFEKLVKYFSF